MSHPNGSFQPSFNYTIDHDQYPYNAQVPQLNINTTHQTQQWPSQRPRSVQELRNQAPSSSGSAHTTRTAPNSRLSDRRGYHQNSRSPVHYGNERNVASDLSHLTPDYRRYDPIARQLQDPSWSVYNPRNFNTNGARSPSSQSNANYRRYGPGSDLDSQVLPSDEGYGSFMTAQSILSNEPGQVSHELSASVSNPLANVDVEPIATGAPVRSRLPSEQRSHTSHVSSRSGKSSKPIQCPECTEVLKCNSDFKKHMLKHQKPFKCDIPNCKRATEGFTTTNDLDRHKKSVHRIGLKTKSYQCAAEHCRNKEKIWPRLDNFKQHVERMHRDVDPLDLIERSVLQPEQPRSDLDDDLTVSPMDTDFAVTGMEKSFSANPAMETTPMLDLPLEQDARRWSSFGQDTDFARNAYPINRQPGGPTSAPSNAHHLGSQSMSHAQQRASQWNAQRNQVSLSVDASTGAASERSSFKTPQSKPDALLSSASQNKAGQQRSALQQRLSEAVASSDNPVDLETLILGIIHQATNPAKRGSKSSKSSKPNSDGPDAVTLTRSDALKASQDFSNHIKRSPGSATFTIQRRSSKGFLPNAKVCQKCGYAVARDCDLRKHMKRHKKPYGCTYPKCHKRFGAKSDWKRHENSQHFQLEAFRCAEVLPFGETCGQHIHREKAFMDHLDSHKLLPEDVQDRLQKCKIGKNCLESFWCGFCKRVEQLRAQRNAAWDERFDHIAHHFERDKKSIDEWVCAEENRSKKEQLKEMDRYVYDDDDEREKDGDVDAAGDVDDDVPLPPPPPPDVIPEMSMPGSNAPPPPPDSLVQGNGEKRPAPDDSPVPPRRLKRRQTTLITNRYCCSCRSPCGAVDVSCVGCSHRICGDCNLVEEETFMMDLFP